MLFATLKGEKIIFLHRLQWCEAVHAHTHALAVVLPGTGDVYVIHKSALPRECRWKLHHATAAWQQICPMVYFYLVVVFFKLLSLVIIVNYSFRMLPFPIARIYMDWTYM